MGRANRLHLVLFDFSLSHAAPTNLRAGTTGYLDPLLSLRKPPRWDLHAERYAAAVTLYEMAAGVLPVWGDGTSDPAQLDCEITLDTDLFDAGLRDQMTEFFRRAFRRDVTQRFDNAQEMLRAWRRCFEGIEAPGMLSEEANADALRELLAGATLETELAALRLGARAANALDRANLLTVRDLLTTPMRRLMRLRGVGNKTRREIVAAVRILRETLDAPSPDTSPSSNSITSDSITANAISAGSNTVDSIASAGGANAPAARQELVHQSIDLLFQDVTSGSKGGKGGETGRRAQHALLGLEADGTAIWPGQAEVARHLGVTRARVGQIAVTLGNRWVRDPALTPLRAEMVALLERAGGVMTPAEIAEALLLTRGSVQDEPERTRRALAVARAAVEAERFMGKPRFQVRRDDGRLFVARDPALADYAARLGDVADRLATEDPLLPPDRALEQLRQVTLPQSAEPLSDARLTRLAAAAGHLAALSSRQEFYPRQMEPIRALKLSQGALYGVKELTVGQLRERVGSRYPDASPLPSRPALDDLLREAGLELVWDPERRPLHSQEIGRYINPRADRYSLSTDSESRTQGAVTFADGEVTDADARHFEERLRRSLGEGAFLALVVPPRRYASAWRNLAARFDVEIVDLDQVFIDALCQAAAVIKARWDVVLKADARPGSADWNRLLLLVERAIPEIERRLLTASRPLLLIHAGLLARYGRMELLELLRDRSGRRDGPPCVWVLTPGHAEARIDDRAVPLLGPGQRICIPETWLATRPVTASL